MRVWPVTVSVIALLAAGCSDTSGDGGTSPPDVTVTSTDTTGTSEPAPEPTDPESTQSQQTKPSIDIVSLPVGGVPDDGQRCNPISWLGGDIPDGVTIKLGTPSFDPPGIFTVDQSGCPGDARSCEGLEWTSKDQPQCWVGFLQVAETGSVTLTLPAKATCESQDVCDQLSKLGGSQIGLTAQPHETTNG
ncbi:hypothetical protein AB0E69_38915 [Kribbella sp. NPDC026611]|uniref:hypothetical protein n=1 Tax=Kribbella sp. NPDC026611 TaxID=3154911 RepID=UPI0033D223F6